jgi:hypothetical protein
MYKMGEIIFNLVSLKSHIWRIFGMYFGIKYCVTGLRMLPECVCVDVLACKCGCASETLRWTTRRKSLVAEVHKNIWTNFHVCIKAHCLKFCHYCVPKQQVTATATYMKVKWQWLPKEYVVKQFYTVQTGAPSCSHYSKHMSVFDKVVISWNHDLSHNDLSIERHSTETVARDWNCMLQRLTMSLEFMETGQFLSYFTIMHNKQLTNAQHTGQETESMMMSGSYLRGCSQRE